MKVKCEFIPTSEGLEYRLHGRVYCTSMLEYLPNSQTLSLDDEFWNRFNKDELIAIISAGKPVTKEIELSSLWYGTCDVFEEV
jgi:hypothetical protein